MAPTSSKIHGFKVHRKTGKSLSGKASGTPLVNGGNSRTSPPSPSGEKLYGKGEGEARREGRDYRFFLLKQAQRMIHFSGRGRISIGGCAMGAQWGQEKIDIRVFEDGRSGFGKMAHCANTYCPICGPRLAHTRMEDAKKAAEYLLKKGLSYIFMTLTAAHTINDDIKDIRVKMSASAKKFFEGRFFKKYRRKGILKHYIVALEVTDDDPYTIWDECTGWHLHYHLIWFLDCEWLTREEIAELQKEAVASWRDCLRENGLTCSDKYGVDIRGIEDWREKQVKNEKWDKKEKKFSLMTDKEKKEHIKRITKYIAKDRAYELTHSGTKNKLEIEREKDEENQNIGLYGQGRVSAWRLLELAISAPGEAGKKARRRWLDLVYGMRGATMFRLSQGLRAEAGLGKEKTDAEKLRADDDRGDVVESFVVDDVFAIMKQGRQGHLASIAAREVPEDVRAETWGGAREACKAAVKGYDILTGRKLPASGVPERWDGASIPDLPVADWFKASEEAQARERAERRAREQAAGRQNEARRRLYGGSFRDVHLLPRLLQRAADRRRGGLATMSRAQLRRIEWAIRGGCWADAAAMSPHVPASCEWWPDQKQVRLPGF